MGVRENRLRKLQISAERETFSEPQIRVYPPFRGHITAFKKGLTTKIVDKSVKRVH